MRASILLLLLCVAPYVAKSQEKDKGSGFMGKRHLLEINTLSNFKFYNALFGGGLYHKKKVGDQLVSKFDWLDYGLRFQYAYIYGKRAAVGFEFGMDFQNVAAYTNGSVVYADGTTHHTGVSHEKLDVLTIGLMPKIVVSGKRSIIPVGVNHEFGVGYTSSMILKHDYLYEIDTTSLSSSLGQNSYDQLNSNYMDMSRSYSGISVMYGFKVKIPINKVLLFNWGLRYNANFLIGDKHASNNGAVISTASTFYTIGRTRGTNLFSLNLGLTYAL